MNANATDKNNNESIIRFQNGDRLRLVKLLGKGGITYAFEAMWYSSATKNETVVVAKINPDEDMFYSHIETDIFLRLREPPTVSNIPEVYFAVRSMPNPFSDAVRLSKMGVSRERTKRLLSKRRIALLAMEFVEGSSSVPSDLDELRKMLRSLLETFRFVHSRSVMHRDLHNLNYFWDGDAKVSIFDWNMAVVYKPNAAIPIHHHNAPEGLFPPEAKKNTSAVHTSVYAYDVYTIGKLARGIMKSCCGWEQLEREAMEVRGSNNTHRILDAPNKNAAQLLEEDMAYDLVQCMMNPNPYQRPDTIAALQHPFFLVLDTDDTNSTRIDSF